MLFILNVMNSCVLYMHGGALRMCRAFSLGVGDTLILEFDMIPSTYRSIQLVLIHMSIRYSQVK